MHHTPPVRKATTRTLFNTSQFLQAGWRENASLMKGNHLDGVSRMQT
jgi:hypothetical protein